LASRCWRGRARTSSVNRALELGQALLEARRRTRPHVDIDHVGEVGALGRREIASRDRRQQILHQDRDPIARRARPAGRISAFALLKLHDLISFSDFRAKIRLRGRGLRARNKKPGAASRPGDWRSFGEYAFLEDSRYASQEESGGI
jgi:hypothetical protein